MEQSPLNRADLSVSVRRAQSGDRDAMETLYLETYPALWRTVRAMTQNDADALDILQESYLLAFTHLGRLRNPARFLPWLKRIAVNELRQQLRKKQPLLFTELAPTEDAPLPDPSAPETPEQLYEQQEQTDAVQQALDRLPDGQRMMLILYYCEQYSIKEISERLSVTQGTVKAQLHHGRKKLEAALRSGSAAGEALALAPLLRSWQAGQLVPAKAPPAALPEQLPQAAAPLAARSAHAVLLTRLAIGAAALALVAGLAVGARVLTGRLHSAGEMQAPAPTELLDAVPMQPASPAELPTAPTEPPTETTEPPTETTEPPAEPTTEPEPEPTTEPAATSPAAPQERPTQTEPAAPSAATAGDLPAAGEAADAASASAVLPTEWPFPFTYQEVTLPVNSTWSKSFATDEEWQVTVFAHTPNLSQTSNVWWSSYQNGVQTVEFELWETGTYTFSLCRNNGKYAWARWLTIHVVAPETG